MKRRVFISLCAVFCAVMLIFLIANGKESYLRDFKRVELNNIEISYSSKQSENSELKHHYFYNLVTSCTHTGVVAEYKGRVEQNGNYEKFENLEVVYGNAPDKYIMIPADMTLPTEPAAGEKYILTLTREESIFHNFPIYRIKQILPLENVNSGVSEFLLKAYSNEDFTDGGYFICKTEIKGINNPADLVSYVKCIALTYGYDILNEAYEPNIFRDVSLKTAVDNSDIIVKIKVKECLEDAPYLKSHKYSCSLTEILKKNIRIESEIFIEALPGSLTENEEYIIILAPLNNKKDGKNFMQAFSGGIIPLKDAKLTEEFYKCYME